MQDEDVRKKLDEAQSFLCAIAEREKIAEKFATAVPPTGNSWIHTPVVVLSNPGKNNPGSVGGHNLRAAVTELALDKEVASGTVQIIGKSVRLNGADIDRAPFLVRDAARGLKSGESPSELEARLSTLLKRTPPRSPRLPAEALKFIKDALPGHVPPSAGILSANAIGVKVPR